MLSLLVLYPKGNMFIYLKPCQKIRLSVVPGFSREPGATWYTHSWIDMEMEMESQRQIRNWLTWFREAAKSWGLHGELASWRARKDNSVASIKWCQAPDPQRADVSAHNWRQDKTKAPDQRPQGTKNSLLLGGRPVPQFNASLQLIRWGSPTLGQAICFTQPTNSNVSLMQKHPHTQS